MVIYPLRTGEYNLVLKITLPPPMPERSYRLSGRYNISLPQSQTPVSRKYDFEINSEGVDAYLDLRNSHYPACQRDILACEIMLLHWANSRLTFPLEEGKRQLLVGYLQGLIDAQESQGTEHGYN